MPILISHSWKEVSTLPQWTKVL